MSKRFENSDGREAVVTELPKCDFCPETAEYDAATVHGPWANMCALHFRVHGRGLGLGVGQRLFTEDAK
jgi:hypothetical protein